MDSPNSPHITFLSLQRFIHSFFKQWSCSWIRKHHHVSAVWLTAFCSSLNAQINSKACFVIPQTNPSVPGKRLCVTFSNLVHSVYTSASTSCSFSFHAWGTFAPALASLSVFGSRWPTYALAHVDKWVLKLSSWWLLFTFYVPLWFHLGNMI